MKLLRSILFAPILLLLAACGDSKEPEESQEDIEDREAYAGIWKWGDTRYIHIVSSGMDQEGERRVSFIEGRLADAGILYSTNGSLGVQGISVPLVDKERALKALSGYLDERGHILPLK